MKTKALGEKMGNSETLSLVGDIFGCCGKALWMLLAICSSSIAAMLGEIRP